MTKSKRNENENATPDPNPNSKKRNENENATPDPNPNSQKRNENENATPDPNPNSKKRYVSPYFNHPPGKNIVVLPKSNENENATPDPNPFSKWRYVSPYFNHPPVKNIVVNENANATPDPNPFSKKRYVSPYFNHPPRKNIVVLSKSNKNENATPDPNLNSNKRYISPYFNHTPGKNIVVLPKSSVNENATPDPNLSSKKRYVSPYFNHPPDKNIIVLPKGIEIGNKTGSHIIVQRKPVKLKPELRSDAYKRKSPDNTWEPPVSPGLRLLQHDHAWDPWRVLVICMLLNKTNGVQMLGFPQQLTLLLGYRMGVCLVLVGFTIVKPILEQLFNLCPDAKSCIQVEKVEIEHVIRSLGLQRKRAKSLKYLSEDYLNGSWTHVTQLHGVGKYAGDAYAIFCTGEWKNVTPTDKELVRYWNYLWSIEHTL
ncbi:hypothetical protein RIF29_02072 [Crotalaria pallida]|uniref:Uncharacterized protein n=1 Tax=Crotalaria pallida TaxID=3830 RepID=A0AAN9P8D8_CROPI